MFPTVYKTKQGGLRLECKFFKMYLGVRSSQFGFPVCCVTLLKGHSLSGLKLVLDRRMTWCEKSLLIPGVRTAKTWARPPWMPTCVASNSGGSFMLKALFASLTHPSFHFRRQIHFTQRAQGGVLARGQRSDLGSVTSHYTSQCLLHLWWVGEAFAADEGDWWVSGSLRLS